MTEHTHTYCETCEHGWPADLDFADRCPACGADEDLSEAGECADCEQIVPSRKLAERVEDQDFDLCTFCHRKRTDPYF